MTYEPRFTALWDRCWRKVGKRQAYKVWLKIGDDERDEIEAAFEAHRCHYARIDVQFRPHLSTWLFQGRWEDELGDPIEVDPQEQLHREQIEQWGYAQHYEGRVQ